MRIKTGDIFALGEAKKLYIVKRVVSTSGGETTVQSTTLDGHALLQHTIYSEEYRLVSRAKDVGKRKLPSWF